MALPEFSMRQLLEAGVHFGHQTHRWNPKMGRYIFGDRNKIHILDLSQTVPLLHTALNEISSVVAGGGRLLFVGTKRQASESISESAHRSAQYYVNARWLGGMLTNWKTISNSIKRLRELTDLLDGDNSGFTKKELLNLTRERDKLERALGGIKDMGGTPDMIFVVDTNREATAIKEAQKLGIPVCAILDSNSDPDGIDFPVPGNDDASRAIALYCDLVARAALDGIERQQRTTGIDTGAGAGTDTGAGAGAGAETSAPAERVVLDDASGTVTEVGSDATSGTSEGDDSSPSIEQPGVLVEVKEKKKSKKQSPKPTSDNTSTKDDLKLLKGVGPKAVEQLTSEGLTTFLGISALSDSDILGISERTSFSADKLTKLREEAGKLLSAGE